MVVALADGAANGKLAGYQTGLGIPSGCVAMGLAPFAVVKQVRQGEGYIGVSGWIALAGSLMALFGVVVLLAATSPHNGSFS